MAQLHITIINIIFLTFILIGIKSERIGFNDDINCDVALQQCADNRICAQSLQEYIIKCQSELNGMRINCSRVCLNAIEALARFNEGDNYLNCVCQADDNICNAIMQRSSQCYQMIRHGVRNGENNDNNEDPSRSPSSASCSDSQKSCASDQMCAQVWQNYRHHCAPTLQGVNMCTTPCYETIQVLSGFGFSVFECRCDENNSGRCHYDKMTLQKFCLGLNVVPMNKDSDYYLMGSELISGDPMGRPVNASCISSIESFILILSLIIVFI